MSLSSKRRALRNAAIAALFSALAACSFVVDKSAQQCAKDADCAGIAGTKCTSGGTCSAGTSCTKNRDCNPGSFCKGSACVSLSSDACDGIVLGPLDEGRLRDDAVLVGALVADSEDKIVQIEERNAMALAALELSPASDAQSGRSLNVVVCDGLGPATAANAARHLVEAVGVKAIVADVSSDTLVDVAQNVTIPSDVLVVSPTATGATVTAIDDRDLVWRTAPSDVLVARAIARTLPELEARVRAQLKLASDVKISLGFAFIDDAHGKAIAAALEPLLMLNGVPATASGDNYIRWPYADPKVAGNGPLRDVGTAMATTSPHIAILVGGSELAAGIVDPMEAKRPRTHFLFVSSALTNALIDTVASRSATGIAAADHLYPRAFGVAPASLESGVAPFRGRYKDAFGADLSHRPAHSALGSYDATYLVGLAASATTTELSGPVLASLLRKMTPPGTKVELGPAGIAPGIAQLRTGSAIDVHGVSGALDFDAAGDTATNVEVWCIPAGAPGTRLTPIYASSYYDAVTDKLFSGATPLPSALSCSLKVPSP